MFVNFFKTRGSVLALNTGYFFRFHLIAKKLFKHMYYGLKVLGTKITQMIFDQLLTWQL